MPSPTADPCATVALKTGLVTIRIREGFDVAKRRAKRVGDRRKNRKVLIELVQKRLQKQRATTSPVNIAGRPLPILIQSTVDNQEWSTGGE